MKHTCSDQQILVQLLCSWRFLNTGSVFCFLTCFSRQSSHNAQGPEVQLSPTKYTAIALSLMLSLMTSTSHWSAEVAQFCSTVMKVLMWQRREKTRKLNYSHPCPWTWIYVHNHVYVPVLKCITSTLRKHSILDRIPKAMQGMLRPGAHPFHLLLWFFYLSLFFLSVPTSGGSVSATWQRDAVCKTTLHLVLPSTTCLCKKLFSIFFTSFL